VGAILDKGVISKDAQCCFVEDLYKPPSNRWTLSNPKTLFIHTKFKINSTNEFNQKPKILINKRDLKAW
jgi:hypothetical protein